MKRAAIIDDVAALAGVSIKTVSRVLNHEPNVREATRNKVRKAARTLDYQPNQSARGLAGRRSFLVGLVYDNPSDSYVVSAQTGALAALQERDYGLVLLPCDSGSEKLPAELAQKVSRARLDGVILTPPVSDHDGVTRILRDGGVPVVRIAPRDPTSGLAVHLDERLATRELIEHLLANGHQRVGIVKGPRHHAASAWRFQTYCEVLRDHGIEPDASLAYEGAFTYESGRAAAEYFLDLAQPPTALFACDDDMAAGVLHKALERGIKVPAQMSVVGFDDLPIARQVWPRLTTIRQPVAEMAAKAVALLIDAIRGGSPQAVEQVSHSLQLRDSVSRIGEDATQ